MKKNKFIILNLLATILEIGLLLFVIIQVIIKGNMIVGYILLIIYLIFLMFMVILSHGNRTVFKIKEFPVNLKGKIDEVHDVFKKTFPDKEIEFIYVDDENFLEPAAYLNNKIYVNSKFKFSPIFFEAILAHELGHAQSKLIRFKIVHLLRITSAFSRFIYSFRVRHQAFYAKKYAIVLDGITFIIYNLFNLFDHLVSFSFFREDEITANSIALQLGYGDALRYFYYYNLIHSSKSGLLVRKFYDYKHPSTNQMLALMEKEMNLDDSELDVFSVHNKIEAVRNASDNNIRNSKVLSWYQYKAKNDDPYFLYELGMIYLKGRYGLIIDNERALLYLEKAREQGYVPAFYQIALYHYTLKEEHFKSFDYFKHASLHEYYLAYKYYAHCLAYGIGTQINQNEAQIWYKLASEKSDKEAINYLSLIGHTFVYSDHSNKNIEVEQDYYIFHSVFNAERIYDNHTTILTVQFQRNIIILLDDLGNEFGRYGFTGDRFIRKNVIVYDAENKNHNTSIFYTRKHIASSHIEKS